ncbi:MAG TPA: IS1380 family transposase [Gemmatimonadales bacterium]|nr:IS1380 family transposase [Gemmatimonadales bacterium]
MPVTVTSAAALLSSDAGLLPIRQFDEQLGFSQQLADALDDPRDPDLIEHTVPAMFRARLYGILAGYEDQNDHDALRADPVFKLVAGRLPTDRDLASQPTLSRFENSVSIASLKRLRDVFIDQFIASFTAPPRHLLFDLDAVDDPAHGRQQLVLFHGYYEQYQYFPLVITCADNDLIVMVSLRHGTAHAALGADEDLEYLVGRLRAVWPGVQIEVRGDAGFGVPWMYDVCERLGLIYTFGLASNAVLQEVSEPLLDQAVTRYDQVRQPQRLFDQFRYQAGTWSQARQVVVKAEANGCGTNRRFIVSNRPGAALYPEAAYDEYIRRGESENRNKELKRGLAGDRLSDHRFVANYFRLYLHSAALNLLVRLRQVVAVPPPVSVEPTTVAADPVARRRRHNERRRRDPLGEGQPATWRLLLIKVAAEVVVSCRRVVVRLSSSWPYRDYYEQVSRAVLGVT